MTEVQNIVVDKRTKINCAHSKMVSIHEIKEHPKNANYHDREQVEILANAIKATGWRTPIGVSTRSGYIIRGHGRFAAAKALGLTEVPVDYQTYESDAQELSDLLADNKIADLGQIDYEGVSSILKTLPQDQLLFTGFRDFEIKPLLAAEWIKPALVDMPETLMLTKFGATEEEAQTIRKAIKILQSKQRVDLTDGKCLEMLATFYLENVIQEEKKAAPAEEVKLASSTGPAYKAPKPVKVSAPIPVELNDLAPRTFKIDYIATTLVSGEDATVMQSTDYDRFYTNDKTFIEIARMAKEKKLTVQGSVKRVGKDLWLTALEIVEEKQNV